MDYCHIELKIYIMQCLSVISSIIMIKDIRYAMFLSNIFNHIVLKMCYAMSLSKIFNHNELKIYIMQCL